MLLYLRKIRKEIALLVFFTFIATPITGFAAAIYLELVSTSEIMALLENRLLIAFTLAMSLWVFVHFWHFLAPILRWIEYDRNNQDAPHQLHLRLKQFTRAYWSFFIFYACIVPILFNLIIDKTLLYKGPLFTLQFILLQCIVVILAAMPTYLRAHNSLGKLARFLGVKYIHGSLKTKLVLIGAVIPSLCMILFFIFQWANLGYVSWDGVAILLLLCTIVLTSTNNTVRGIRNSLLPVQKIFSTSGATDHSKLINLKPQSTDEIGYLMQTIGKVFRQLADQRSHMHAVVDNAAEGIIVVDSEGTVDTFNIAAQNLFGYSAHEAKGLPLSHFLPALVSNSRTPTVAKEEQEIEGVHRNGRRISMSAHVSKMQMSDKTMYTCLVADITARKAAQIKQIRAETRYRDLVETAHDLVWICDAEGKWIYLNKAATTIYGYSPAEMIGHFIKEYHDPAFCQQESKAFAEILKGKELYQFETVHLDKNGHPHYLSFNAKAQRDILGNVQQITGTARDISEKKAFEKQLSYQAEHDVLTGLFNRRFFQQELERVCARVTRSAGSCGLLYIDLDQFKYINDTLGHAAGDRLLVEISSLLSNNMREGELLARFGGDEFTMLLYNIGDTGLQNVAEKFCRLFNEYKFLHNGNAINITCSIGGTLLDCNTKDADEAMARADMACHMAKSNGRNCVHLYDPGTNSENNMAADMGWAARVRDMLETDRMVQVYQPIVSVKTGSISHYEVLLRMPCDDGKLMLPGGFLPAAERFGLIQSIDRWVTEKSIEQLKIHKKNNQLCRFSINLSSYAFDDPTLLPLVKKLLRKSAINPANLIFEITESAAIKNLDLAVKLIHSLKELGCQFSLDDFGSGFNSFTYLKHLPVDHIKIDGSFVRDIATNSVDLAMVTSMNQIAHALNKKTIAECVENIETYETLKEIGIDYVQGFYLGKPSENLILNKHLPRNCSRVTA